MRTNAKRILDFAVYIIIPLAACSTMFIATAYDMSPENFISSAALIIATLVIFGSVIKENKTLWRRKSFWIMLCAVFIANSLIFAVFRVKKINLSGAHVVAVCLIEICIIQLLAKRMASVTTSPK